MNRSRSPLAAFAFFALALALIPAPGCALLEELIPPGTTGTIEHEVEIMGIKLGTVRLRGTVGEVAAPLPVVLLRGEDRVPWEDLERIAEDAEDFTDEGAPLPGFLDPEEELELAILNAEGVAFVSVPIEVLEARGIVLLFELRKLAAGLTVEPSGELGALPPPVLELLALAMEGAEDTIGPRPRSPVSPAGRAARGAQRPPAHVQEV